MATPQNGSTNTPTVPSRVKTIMKMSCFIRLPLPTPDGRIQDDSAKIREFEQRRSGPPASWVGNRENRRLAGPSGRILVGEFEPTGTALVNEPTECQQVTA